MKKYLITAAMAVAVSGTFVSCHDDEITGSTVEQKIQAFEDIFTQAFGKPAPNHTFGFGDPIELEGVTRSINVNGNLWEDCPAVGTKEEADVLAYLATLQTKEKNPVRLQNYFVTQIHKGTETYKNQDGGDVGVGSDKMNNLHIAMSSDVTINNGVLSAEGPTAWDHINNFNAGTCNDWGAGDADGEGNTLVLNGGTFNFAYQGSEDSKYHDRWCSIDGKDVPRTDGVAANYAGYYYICFDFEQDVDGKTAAYFKDENGVDRNINLIGSYHSVAEATGVKFTVELGEWVNGVFNKTGEKEYVFGESAGCTGWRVDNVINGNMIVNPNSSYKDWIIRLVKAERENIPQVKVITSSSTTDGYVARKIISAEKVVKSGRIFCEDIVSAKYELEDLDYNDVVFDAAIINTYRKLVTTYLDNNRNPLDYFPNGDKSPKVEYDFDISGYANGYNSLYAIVRLLAAGGTLPIEIKVPSQYNADVHNVLGQTSTTIMINTLDKTEREKVNMAAVAAPVRAKDLEKATGDEKNKFYDVNDLDNGIELNVEYGNIAAGIKSKYYDDETGEVVASAKLMVPLGTPWAKERVNIADAYPRFNDWIKNESVKFWDYPSSNTSYFYNDNTNTIVGLDPVKYAKDNIISNNGEEEVIDLGVEEIKSDSYSEDLIDATNTYMATPTGTTIYDYNSTNVGPGYLYDGSTVTASSRTDITTGSKIRVYGVSINNWEVTCSGLGITASTYTENGYIEFDVTKDLGRSLVFTGKNFTITYVSVVETTPTPVVDNDETTKPVQIWPSDGNNGSATQYFEIDSEPFKKGSASQKLCIYCTIGNSSWLKINKIGWSQWTLTDLNSSWRIVNENKELEPVNGLSSVYNQTKGCIEVQLSAGLIEEFKKFGMGLNFGENNMTITSIKIE